MKAALTACALWFTATTKLSWAKECQRDPELVPQLELEVLPALSTANVREMLRSVMPFPQLSPEEAQAQVAKHLVNRSRSTASRLRHHRQVAAPTQCDIVKLCNSITRGPPTISASGPNSRRTQAKAMGKPVSKE